MIDLHCHILPGLDDGAVDIGESLAIAEKAAEDGIHKIIATPHVYEDSIISPPIVKDTVDLINKLLQKYGIDVTLYPGAEVGFGIPAPQCQDWVINNSSYILVELPHSHVPAESGNYLELLLQQGLKPILSHPERNEEVIRDPECLLKLPLSQLSLQLTAASITGEFGPEIRQCAFFLMQQEAFRFIASDAHSATYRKPGLSAAVKKAARLIGNKKAQAAVTDFPLAVLENSPLIEIA